MSTAEARFRQLADHHNEASGQPPSFVDLAKADRFVLGEVVEVEKTILDQLRRENTGLKQHITDMEARFTAELDKANKRVTTMTGVLIGALGSTAVAGVAFGINALA